MFPTVGKLGNIFWETLAHMNLKLLFMFAVQSLRLFEHAQSGKTMFLVFETI